MMGLEHTTSLSRAYRERRDALEETFPAAAAFLKGLEVLCEGEHGFHMGTALNVQFYLEDAFLFYLQLRAPRSDRPSLLLSPYHHGQLREGTRDAAHVIFRHRIRSVIDTLALSGSLVMRRQRGYLIFSDTPPAFFDLWIAQLLAVVRAGEVEPLQTELFGVPRPKRPRRRQPRRSSQGRRRSSQGRRQRPTLEQRLVSMAREIDESLGVLTAELGDRLGDGVRLEVEAGRARMSLAPEQGQGPEASRVVQSETLVALLEQALAISDVGEEAASEELEELESFVIEEMDR